MHWTSEDQALVDEERAVAALARSRWPREPVPYVARLRLVAGGGTLDVLFAQDAPATGSRTDDLVRVNFRASPFTAVLLGGKENGPFEVTRGGSVLRGTIARLVFVTFRDGEIAEIVDRRATLVREKAGGFRREAPPPSALRPRAALVKARAPSLVDVDLDPAQRAAVTLPAGRALLVLGEAGHGKTTVALHRLAHLAEAARGRLRAAVIVPTEGLRTLLQAMLTRLGVDVDVEVYDAWAARRARRAFPDVPRRESTGATAAVVRVKRHPALRAAIAEIASRPPGRVNDDFDAPDAGSPANARWADLQHLFGDSAVLERAFGAGLPAHALAEILEHTRVQFGETSEVESAHVDAERLVTVDHESIDAGSPNADASTIDVEDYAVLFAIDRERAARAGVAATRTRRYDCIVLDEAQELAALELALLGRSLAKGGTLVVAGDADQQLDDSTSFAGWDQVMGELGCASFERVTLDVGYRCPPEVVAIAHQALGRADAGSAGAPIVLLPDELRLVDVIVNELRRLGQRDPRATVAVIARTPLAARRLADLVRLGAPARLVLDGRFGFGTPHITCVDQVRGLEFDFVIVPDASAAAYPDVPAARRALYVTVTRARHQVLLLSPGEPTPILGRGAPLPP